MVLCHICNKKYRRITKSHLNKHNLSMDEYKFKFPNSILIDDALRYVCGTYFRNNNPMHNEYIKKKVIQKITGLKRSEKTKLKISQARQGKTWGHHTKEHKEKMKLIMKLDLEKRKKNGWAFPPMSNAGKKRLSDSMLGNTRGKNGHHNKGKKLNLTDEQRLNRSRKRIQYIQKNPIKFKNTNIELKCREFLIKHNLRYIPQYELLTKSNAWLYDFYIPSLNLILEIDGEYWHSSRKQINRDILKENEALTQGFKFLRISDENLNFNLIFKNKLFMNNHNIQLIQLRKNKL